MVIETLCIFQLNSSFMAGCKKWKNSVLYILLKCPFFIYLLIALPAFSQKTTIVNTGTDRWHKIVIPGKQYDKSALHNWLWGKHYRKEWKTPVKVNILRLDSAFGGLTPVEKGGGRQTRNLRLEDKNGKEYVLRSIDKTYKRALPEIFQGTFVETIANDEVSVAHPYAPFTVPVMAEAARIYHTNPRLVFLPADKLLGEFNDEFSNQLYLLEERPDGDQSNSPNFGNAKDVIGTEKMMEKITESNANLVDQKEWIRARLFDMFLGDWGRHEDQWRWSVFKKDDITIYKPVPRDRDQAFTKFDGLLVSKPASTSAFGYLQSFDYTIKDVNKYNYQARYIDRRLANEVPLNTWMATATELTQLLTDAVIEKGVKQLPPEATFSANEIIAKLKSRRDHLPEYAKEYYTVLAKETDIVGSKQNEIFEISTSAGGVTVNVYRADNNESTGLPFYSRRFVPGETKEIRIYGLDGNDKFNITGPPQSIKILIIGGPSEDRYTATREYKNIAIYDNTKNSFNTSGKIKQHLSDDPAIHHYDYYSYKYDKSGLKPGISYGLDDRLFVTLGYMVQKQKWRKTPFGSQHNFNINYSITQKAFSAEYKAIYNQFIGKWNLGLLADYDLVRDVYFAGIGNNTVKNIQDKRFYKMRSREFNSGISFIRPIDSSNTFNITGFFKMIKLLDDGDKFISVSQGVADPSVFDQHSFTGLKFDYTYQTVNGRLIGTKGIKFTTSITPTYDLTAGNLFTRFSGLAGFYLPITPSLVVGVKTGGATVTGNPPLYELNKLGGGSTLRGHLRFRYYGKTTFYNQNELQWNIKIKSWFMNGYIGLLGFFDNGRVWYPGETSNLWQTGYGFGLMIAPFNKFSFTASYGMSAEGNAIHVRLGRLL